MPSFKSPFPPDVKFHLSCHAQERVLQRTQCAGGQILDYLQQGNCVWLNPTTFTRSCCALVYQHCENAYHVAIMTAKGQLKTVLTLAMYEETHGPVASIWLVLLRAKLANHAGMSSAIGVARAHALEFDQPWWEWRNTALDVKQELAQVRKEPPATGFWLRWVAGHCKGAEWNLVELGYMDFRVLDVNAAEYPQMRYILPDDAEARARQSKRLKLFRNRAAAGGESWGKLDRYAKALVWKPAFQRWLQARLSELPTEVADSFGQLTVELGFGASDPVVCRRAELTSELEAALQLGAVPPGPSVGGPTSLDELAELGLLQQVEVDVCQPFPLAA